LFKNSYEGSTEDETVRIQGNGVSWFNGGNVGIGTTSPGKLLHVETPVNTSENLVRIASSMNNGSRSISGIEFVTNPQFYNADNGQRTPGCIKSGFYSDGVAGLIANWPDSYITLQTTITGALVDTLTCRGGNVGIGTTGPDERLHVVGNIKHEGLTMTSGTDVDQMITIPISLSFDGSTWYTITSGSSHLTTGTWIVKVYIHSASGAGSGQLYDETYSGMFTWYSGGTNSTVVNDIALHNAGHAQNAEVISMRTRRTGSGGVNLILEINSNISWGGTVRTTSFFCRRLL
jgi:hypothetical protein